MEHLLQMSKCSIFHNIFKYMIFQRRQKALLWSKGLTLFQLVTTVLLYNLCKKFGPRSGPTICQARSGSKLIDTDGMSSKFLKESLKQLIQK